MKKVSYVSLLLIGSLLFFKCQKELSLNNSFFSASNNQPAPVSADLQGNIIDENNRPVAGVSVTVATANAVTDAKGYFKISHASLDKNASLVTAELPGYFKAYRTFSGTSGTNRVFIKLIKKALAGTVNAATGGSVQLAEGAVVLLKPNSIVNTNGIAYTQNVYVYAAYIDPTATDIGKTVPGSFIADDADDKRVVLNSYGMMAIDLESFSGERLQIATGNTATLTMPIPEGKVSGAPASISLWYIDEQSGIWKEQGTSKKTRNNYVGDVKHFCYWNNDTGLPGINFTATLKTSNGTPLINTGIIIKPASNSPFGYAHGFTDTLGQVSGLIPSSLNLTFEVLDECGNVVYSKDIGPFAQNTDLGTYTISSALSSVTTIKGRLVTCNAAPVTAGYALIDWNNVPYYVHTDASGKFSMDIFTCSAIPPSVNIIGVDENAQLQGTVLTLPITSQVNDAGDISACGTSSLQFISYTLDGKEYKLPTATTDSIRSAFTNVYGSSYSTFIEWNHSGDNYIYFNFTGNNEKGVYRLKAMDVLNYNRIGLIAPFNVDLTSFPQSVGEFYEGSFSGSFKDSADISITHNISCTFRMQKQF
jgi:hypothetical protein